MKFERKKIPYHSLVLLVCVVIFLTGVSSAQWGGPAGVYGGKPLRNSEMTFGGKRILSSPPQYGGQVIDESALYNPYLDEAFSRMGKPLFSPNPNNRPYIIDYNNNNHPYNFSPDTMPEPYLPHVNSNSISFTPKISEENLRKLQKKEKEKNNIPTIIPVLIGSIDALSRESSNGNDTVSSKRLSLDGWYGTIRQTSENSGSFNIRNQNGESISGSYYINGSRINFNINQYGEGKTQYWNGSSYMHSSGSSINLQGNNTSLTGSSSLVGDNYYYQFKSSGKPYQLQIRGINSSSQSVRITENNGTSQYGYIN